MDNSNSNNTSIRIENENIYGNPNFNEVSIELPYIGYYDVTMILGFGNMTKPIIKTKKKCIKVEPYNIELLGFYYDARNLPKLLKYDMDDNMKDFIQNKIDELTRVATAERDENTEVDFSMPTPDSERTGPYFGDNFSENWYIEDNLSEDIIYLRPIVENTRYIKNGVDVKPFTWFLLTYDYTKIVGKKNKPLWTIINNTTKEERTYEGNYFTFLLKKEGNYTVKLNLEDKNDNKYEISRNIVVVNKTANYNIYQTFKKDYDFIKSLNEY